MSNRVLKIKMTSHDLIAMLRDEKGIRFEIADEATAERYLLNRNNYLRTASYRHNYEKHQVGALKGKYIDIDFSYLMKLSTIDSELRSILLEMCIDIEHELKISLLKDIENNSAEDGYSIVESFLKENPNVVTSIEHKADSIFTGDLICKYFNLCTVFQKSSDFLSTRIASVDCPAWVLIEIIAFKDLLTFDKHYCNCYGKQPVMNPKILNPIRSLRNACAHNNCLFASLHPRKTKPTSEISQFVSNISTIGDEERRKKLSSKPLFEIVSLLYTYDRLVDSELKKKRYDELDKFVSDYLMMNKESFKTNQLITTSFSFLEKMVKHFISNN